MLRPAACDGARRCHAPGSGYQASWRPSTPAARAWAPARSIIGGDPPDFHAPVVHDPATDAPRVAEHDQAPGLLGQLRTFSGRQQHDLFGGGGGHGSFRGGGHPVPRWRTRGVAVASGSSVIWVGLFGVVPLFQLVMPALWKWAKNLQPSMTGAGGILSPSILYHTYVSLVTDTFTVIVTRGGRVKCLLQQPEDGVVGHQDSPSPGGLRADVDQLPGPPIPARSLQGMDRVLAARA